MERSMNRLTRLVFIILVFLFSTLECLHSTLASMSFNEREALIALYNSTDGDNWRNNSGWKTPPLYTDGFAMPGTEGTWYGVNVSSDRVISVSLYCNQLTGSIPPELGNLANLQTLDLAANKLTGSIPPELGNLANLQTLDLSFDGLIGSIPPELGNLANLQWLELGSNQLTGSIPAELGNLANLQNLLLYTNQLTGSIPPELGNLSNLQELHLSYNQLTGSIPPGLENLANLENLDLWKNQLTGNIPPELGNLANLQDLSLASNQLTGSIPVELENLTILRRLSLHSNQLTGSIPAELGNLAHLEFLDLHINQLTGSIPPELGNLANLEFLDLRSNQVTGIIPAELGNLTHLIVLDLSSNELIGSIPTELMNWSRLWDLDICDNHLYTTDPGLQDFLDTFQPEWEDCQEPFVYYRDADEDGYGNPNDSLSAYSQPEGYVLDNTDNCPCTQNPEQEDGDGDGCGDACDGRPDNPNWVSIYGSITYGENPLCTMVLANGQHMFTCGDDVGLYDLDVPLEENGEISLYGFCSGFSPFKTMLGPKTGGCYDISMVRTPAGSRKMEVAFQTKPGTTNSNWVRVSGTAIYDGTPLCAMILANGQSMFSCGDDLGTFDLEVPLDGNGEITLYVFCSGFAPYKEVFVP
jgi:Leucine-rich repeat (LRR) protein